MHKENKIKENTSCTDNEEETFCCTWEVEIELRRKHGEEGKEVILHAWGGRMKVIQPPKWKKLSSSCTYNIERRCVVHTREEKRLRHKEVISHAQGKMSLRRPLNQGRGYVTCTRKKRTIRCPLTQEREICRSYEIKEGGADAARLKERWQWGQAIKFPWFMLWNTLIISQKSIEPG